MKQIHESVQIDVPVDVAWRLLSDVVRWPQWLPTISRISALGSGVTEVGARFVVKQPKLPPATWQVTEVHPPYSFVWESRSPGLRTSAMHDLTTVGPGACRLDLHLAFSGLLGNLMGWLFASLTRSYLAKECEAFKAVAEKSAQ